MNFVRNHVNNKMLFGDFCEKWSWRQCRTKFPKTHAVFSALLYIGIVYFRKIHNPQLCSNYCNNRLHRKLHEPSKKAFSYLYLHHSINKSII